MEDIGTSRVWNMRYRYISYRLLTINGSCFTYSTLMLNRCVGKILFSPGVSGSGQITKAGCISLKTQARTCPHYYTIPTLFTILLYLSIYIYSGDFVRANDLQEGDFIVLYSDVKCGKYVRKLLCSTVHIHTFKNNAKSGF